MSIGLSRFTAGFFGLILAAGIASCGSDDDSESGTSALIAKMRSCGLITDGKVASDLQFDDCDARCMTNGSCEDLVAFACSYNYTAFEECWDRCDQAEGEFNCADGSGTTQTSWKCDGNDDCPDGSDEIGCPATSVFTCADGETVPADWKCDAEEDCEDGSDEVGCPAGTRFSCADGSREIDADLVCDLQPNCDDGSDEAQGCAQLQCD